MLTHVTTVLLNADIPRETADTLARQVMAPPPGSIDVAELAQANETQIALLAAVVAAMDLGQFGGALQRLLGFVGAAQATLSDYDSGRFWHLTGFAAWRLDHALYPATHALNRSLALLQRLTLPHAQAYLARVHDTFGQLLQQQGLLRDAQQAFATALHCREAVPDNPDIALTLGNLGRLCLERGDFATAAVYFTRDLALVTQRAPQMTRVRIQLLSHLGTCALEQGDLEGARDFFTHSAALAQDEANVLGLAFAALGLGQVALRGGETVQAQHYVEEARRHLSVVELPPAEHAGVIGLLHQLTAEIHLAHGQAAQAMADFAAARASFQQATNVSPVEKAQLLAGFARACAAHGESQQAAVLFREALQCLDATAADALRAAIERELHEGFRESWLLHTAGRFVGQQHIAFLLDETGHAGFRGAQQEIVILFADLCGFTSIAEHFAPHELITFLNDYLGHMTRCVETFGGMVDKFIGDAVMAIFSLPTPRPDDAMQAVLAALMMQAELERCNRTLPPGAVPLGMGLGLHTGPVVAGLIGSPQKRAYTVIGDAVNTASRLEGLTRHLGASLLISADVVRRLPTPSPFLLRPLGTYRLKGRSTPVAVYDVMGLNDGSRLAQMMLQEIVRVHEALAYYTQRQFAQAQAAFAALASEARGTAQARHAQGYRFLASKARHYLRNPPRTPWDGAITMAQK